VPRLVFSYTELSATRSAGGMVVELAPEVAADLRALRVEIPGLGAALSGQPAIAFSLGLDLARAQKVAAAAAERVKQLGIACGLVPLASGAGSFQDAVASPLPEPIGRIAGGVVSVRDIALSRERANPMPTKLEGVAVIASPDARALFAKLGQLQPQLAAIEPDGKLHDLAGVLPLPFGVSAGVAGRAIVIAAGDKRAAAGDQQLAARAVGRAPLFAVAYDYGKLMELQGKLQMAAAGESADDLAQLTAVYEAMRNVFGRAVATLDVTPAGVRMWGSLEIK
jgi:hypothetical protein